MSAPFDWLLFGATVPLFGAAVLFLLWGALLFIVAGNKTNFKYHWPQAFDPLGWLYGGAALAVQVGARGWGQPKTGIVPFVCFVAAAICLLLLIAAMTERGKDKQWTPPKSLITVSVALVLAILCAGFAVQSDMNPVQGDLVETGKSPNGTSHTVDEDKPLPKDAKR